MFCSNCGKKVDDGSQFCPFCGAALKEDDTVPVQQPAASESGTPAVSAPTNAETPSAADAGKEAPAGEGASKPNAKAGKTGFLKKWGPVITAFFIIIKLISSCAGGETDLGLTAEQFQNNWNQQAADNNVNYVGIANIEWKDDESFIMNPNDKFFFQGKVNPKDNKIVEISLVTYGAASRGDEAYENRWELFTDSVNGPIKKDDLKKLSQDLLENMKKAAKTKHMEDHYAVQMEKKGVICISNFYRKNGKPLSVIMIKAKNSKE